MICSGVQSASLYSHHPCSHHHVVCAAFTLDQAMVEAQHSGWVLRPPGQVERRQLSTLSLLIDASSCNFEWLWLSIHTRVHLGYTYTSPPLPAPTPTSTRCVYRVA